MSATVQSAVGKAAKRPADPLLSIVSACYVLFAASIIFNLLPVFLGQAAIKFELDNQELGLLGSSALLGFGAASASAPFWYSRVPKLSFCRNMLLASAVCLAVTPFAPSLNWLIGCLLLSGAFGGAVFAVTLEIIGETQLKERNFAISILVIQGTSALCLLSLGQFIALREFTHMTIAMAVLVAFAAAACSHLPRNAKANDDIEEDGSDTTRSATFLRPLLALAALALFGIGVVGVWAFLERIAADAGIEAGDIYLVLAQGYLAGAVGASAATMLSDKAGRTIPILIASAGLVATLMLAPSTIAAGSFLIIALGFQFTWNFAIAYQFTIISDSDRSGRFLVAAPAAQALGAVVGPAVGGLLSGTTGFAPVLLFGATTVAASGLLFISVDRLNQHQI